LTFSSAHLLLATFLTIGLIVLEGTGSRKGATVLVLRRTREREKHDLKMRMASLWPPCAGVVDSDTLHKFSIFHLQFTVGVPQSSQWFP
jgi:hypothetical protein